MDYAKHFDRLNTLLTEWQPVIHYRPFHGTELPENLTGEQRQLLEALQKLSPQELHACENNRLELMRVIKHSSNELTGKLEDATHFEAALPHTEDIVENENVDRFFNVGIPGRKWQQIKNFAAALPVIDTPIIDWCSGKGHLARLVSVDQQQPVTCLEYDAQLCRDGDRLARQQGLALNFVEQDVLRPLNTSLKLDNRHFTALHACGDLHMSLLKSATEHPISGLSLSPCCYQKIQADHYQPLSAVAKKSSLKLARQDLALAVAETVTGGARIARQRHQERLWRIAFDLLQKQHLGQASKLQLPSISKKLLSQPINHFLSWAMESKGLNVPMPENAADLLEQAEQKLLEIRKLELAQRPFKRILEQWLILDRVIYLQDHGFDCQLSIFCERATTPRNFLIQARR